MRSFAPVLLAILAVSCAAAPQPPAPVAAAVVVAAPPGSVSAAAAEPASDFDPQAPPAGSALTASIDPDKVSQFLAAIVGSLGPAERMMLERFLPDAGRALTSPHAGSALGIDSHRPIRFGIALTAQGKSALQALRNLQVKLEEQPGIAQAVDSALNERSGPKVHARVSVPVIDPSIIVGILEGLFAREGWRNEPAPPGYQSMWSEGSASIAIASRQGHLVIDVFAVASIEGDELARAAAQAAREAALARPEAAPLLEGHGVRVWFMPQRVAELGFVDGMSRSAKAMGAADSSVRDRIMSAAWREVSRNFLLARNERGPWFESVELTADASGVVPSVRGRARAGAGLGRASASCSSSASVEFPGADGWFDMTTSCLTSLPAPGDRYEPSYARTEFFSYINEAGWTGDLVALPFQIMSPGRAALRDEMGIKAEALLKMDRFGVVVVTSGPDVTWGLMPAGTAADEAACAHEGRRGCRGRLTAGATVKVADGYVRLLKISGRYVLLGSRDKQSVEALAPRIGSRATAPMNGRMSGAAIARELRQIPLSAQVGDYGAQAQIEPDGAWVLAIGPGL